MRKAETKRADGTSKQEHNKHDKERSNMCRLTALRLIINNHWPWPKRPEKRQESGSGCGVNNRQCSRAFVKISKRKFTHLNIELSRISAL